MTNLITRLPVKEQGHALPVFEYDEIAIFPILTDEVPLIIGRPRRHAVCGGVYQSYGLKVIVRNNDPHEVYRSISNLVWNQLKEDSEIGDVIIREYPDIREEDDFDTKSRACMAYIRYYLRKRPI